MKTELTTIRYSSNNSGGDWWLSDEDWRNLEKEGWKVEWRPERYMGALATAATKENTTEEDAIADWESITGKDSSDQGFPCCGQPHNFYEE